MGVKVLILFNEDRELSQKVSEALVSQRGGISSPTERKRGDDYLLEYDLNTKELYKLLNIKSDKASYAPKTDFVKNLVAGVNQKYIPKTEFIKNLVAGIGEEYAPKTEFVRSLVGR